VGDLAGKHGTLVAVDNATPVTATYTDAAIMLHGPTSVVGLSIVVHAPNGTRLACATIVALTGDGTVRHHTHTYAHIHTHVHTRTHRQRRGLHAHLAVPRGR
jgi:hypothetical protein